MKSISDRIQRDPRVRATLVAYAKNPMDAEARNVVRAILFWLPEDRSNARGVDVNLPSMSSDKLFSVEDATTRLLAAVDAWGEFDARELTPETKDEIAAAWSVLECADALYEARRSTPPSPPVTE